MIKRRVAEEKKMLPSEKRSNPIAKIIVLITIITGFLVLAKYFNLRQLFYDVLVFIHESGVTGLFVFFGLYVIATVFMLPGTLLTLGAGALFGVVKGSAIVSISSTVGATAAFLIGRYLARDIISRRFEGNVAFRAVDAAVGREGWKIVGLTRLSPIFPFILLNYAFGLTRISLRAYVLASWIGMIPGTVMYVYLGSLAGSLAQLGAKEGEGMRSPIEWGFYVVGLLATVAITILITRIARRALDLRMKAGQDNKEIRS
jgi:uncharacterized membrane protein YdjX (TVP38/TMEM64 family)